MGEVFHGRPGSNVLIQEGDPDEFGKAMLGRSRPCRHGRLRALRDCEFCDHDERQPPAVTRIFEADGYQLRITIHRTTWGQQRA